MIGSREVAPDALGVRGAFHRLAAMAVATSLLLWLPTVAAGQTGDEPGQAEEPVGTLEEDGEHLETEPIADDEEEEDEEEEVHPPERLEVIPGLYPENTGMFYGGQGIWAGTPDRQYTLRATGFVHLDTRFATDGQTDDPEMNVFWRRIRLTVDGRIAGNLEYRLMWDLFIDPLVPYDFHLDWRPAAEFNIRVGGFKSPVSFERRARSYALWFIERAFPAGLAPNRELGIFAYGQTRDGFFSYDIAMVSGGENLGVLYEFRDTPDFAGRLYFQPFRLMNEVPDELRYFGIGVAWSIGEEIGDLNAGRLQSTRATPRRSVYGGRLLHQYRQGGEGDVMTVAHGRRDRQGVHAHWRHRQFNTVFEFIRSANEVATLDETGQLVDTGYLANYGWMLVLSYTVNPEDQNTYFGVNPTRPFDPSRGQWGGATISARYQELYIDDATFPIFADPGDSVRGARAVGLSFQWHINQLLEAQLDTEFMAVDGPLPHEFSVMTRVEGRY